MSDYARLTTSAVQLERFALMSPADRRAATEPARRELAAQFAAAVDRAVPGLDPAERSRRIEMLKSAHFRRVRAASITRPVRTPPKPDRLSTKLHTLAHEMWADEIAERREA